MSEILCRWLNSELRLSKPVDPISFAKDFSNGYLIGEVLNKYQLQEDFHQFSKHSTANAKLNNFTRLEPTLQLLGVPFDLNMAKAVMQSQQGATTRLLYQLYVLLQKKKRSGLTGVAMETMQPAATARLHRVENHIYTQHLRTLVKRESDVKMQKIAQRFDRRGREAYGRSVTAELEREERRRHLQDQMRLQDIQKHRQARRKQQEMMQRIHAASVQIPKPPASSKKRHRHPPDTKNVLQQITEFEQNRKRRSPASRGPSSLSVQMNEEEMDEWNSAYVQKIRKRLEEDAAARDRREKRRRRALIQQLQTHQAHEEARREEQLIGRLMRQSQQEKRMAVQLMQIHQQKEVLRQNRLERERQFHEQRGREFRQGLDREAALLQQDRLDRADELRKERELHEHLAAERAQSRFLKHFNICRGILEQIVDLATRTGEYRLLTSNMVPVKMLREWRELWISGKPLYEVEPSVEQNTELEKLRILNQQDYHDYTTMTGEWAWPEEEENKAPPSNNDILGHLVGRLRKLVAPDGISAAPTPPRFPLQACVLGNTCSGKTRTLARIGQVNGIHVLSVDSLIQEALEAHRAGEPEPENEVSVRAQHGAAVEEALRRGEAAPDHLLIDIIVHAIRKVPLDRGWVLDGFPTNVSQARLLEKELGGVDPDQEKRRDKIHELVVDRNAPQTPPPAPPVLHLAVLLQVCDEQVLERHRLLHEREASGGASEEQQIQHRISGFHEAWPELEEWFGEKQKVLVKVDAEVDEDELFSKVESVLLDAMQQSHTGLQLDMKSDPSAKGPSRRASASSPPAAEAPPSCPGSASWVFVDEPLPKEIPEYLVPYWMNVCTSYVSSAQAAMQNLRQERNLIIHHLYNIREDYKQYLQRPDLKQEFMAVWQRDYNNIPDDMRHDVETKAELHQRLEDLRERLYDISEKRKDEALQEKAALTESGWLEDHAALLMNHYCSLMQVEVDRFQDTLHVVRVYYSGMYRGEVPGCTHQNDPANQPERSKRVSLNGPLSTDPSGQKGLVLTDVKLVQDIHHNATTAITNMVSVELQQLHVEENEEQQQPVETESQTSASIKTSDKDKKRGNKKKSPPPQTQESVPPPLQESAEERQRRSVRTKIREEFRRTLQHEESSVCKRLELVKLQCVLVLHSLQNRAELAHRDLEQWGDAQYLSEIHSIDQLAGVVSHHIESGEQIKYELVLARSNFYADGDLRVVSTPPLLSRSQSAQPTNQDSFNLTVQQLHGLHSHLRKIAPTGVMTCNHLCEVLQELSSLGLGSDALPQAWIHVTDTQIREMVSVLAQGGEMVDWRHFLLCAAQPWPLPSQKQLINTYTHFKQIDTTGGGVINLQQYLQVELWFPSEKDLPVPENPTEPPAYDRLAELRKLWFSVFADASSPAGCNYMDMLLYFCARPDPAHGFITALSLLIQHTLHYTHTPTTMLQSYVEGGVYDDDDDDDDKCSGDEDVLMDDVLRVVNHHKMSSNEEIKQDLMDVCDELGFQWEKKILFSVLSKHHLIQDLMKSSTQYQLIDIYRILHKQQNDEDPVVSTVPQT
ncbi:sperm flagellar protein 2 [Trichomycterus rosablanca]|uniref:sperm flagellar protein 2 n=1 Tax=Trichomycterus rosablanca TaxID=2290929 RepID=UPI002F35A99B